MKPIKIGICGLGTVGSGTFNVLIRNDKQITDRAGRNVVIEQVASRRDNPLCNMGNVKITRDIFDVASNPDIDIVVELIGGCDAAKKLILAAIDNGKHVVTANKALIAEHGNEIFSAAKKKRRVVAYEAAVAGGIPIIKCLREGLVGNKFNWLVGIINGTGNYILTEMGDKDRPFKDVLEEAQKLGYAEADPTFDVEGIDACHKLTIMASIAFGIPLKFGQAFTEGISGITPIDIRYAEELGYRIKHLGIARRQREGIEIRVHPTLIPAHQPIANINGVLNTIVVDTDALGQTMYTGAGAGSEATASSVISDIVDIARIIDTPEAAVNSLNCPTEKLDASAQVIAIDDITSSYYLRIQVKDKLGVMNAITQILSENGVNISAITQKEVRAEGHFADITILTQSIKERAMKQALKDIESLSDIQPPITRIRVESMKSNPV